MLALRAAEITGYQITYIFTDGGVWDSGEARGILEALARYGKIFLFLIGSEVTDLHEDVQALTDIAVVHETKADKSLVEESLSEYFNR